MAAVAAILLLVPVVAQASFNRLVEIFYPDLAIVVDGKRVELAEQPFVLDGRTYVSLRSIAEIFGADVSFDVFKREIYVKMPVSPGSTESGGKAPTTPGDPASAGHILSEEGTLTAAGKQTFSFTVPAGEWVVVDLAGRPSDEVDFYLFDPGGAQITQSTNSSSEIERRAFEVRKSGTYQVKVSGKEGAKFALRVYRPGPGQAMATALVANGQIEGSIPDGAGQIYYQVQMSPGDLVTIDLSRKSHRSLTLVVYDEAHKEMGRYTAGPTARYILDSHATRTYYVGVMGPNGAPYELSIYETVSGQTHLKPIPIQGFIQGEVPDSIGRVYYAFEATAGDQIKVNIDTSHSFYVDLFDDRQWKIRSASTYTDKNVEMVVSARRTGTYVILVNGAEGSTFQIGVQRTSP